MKGGEKKNLTQIIWKLTNKKDLDRFDKKIVDRITDGYEANPPEYNLTEKESVEKWFASEGVKYIRAGNVTSGNKGTTNVKYDNIEAVKNPASIIKILALAKPNIPREKINKGLSNNGGIPLPPVKKIGDRTLRVPTPQLTDTESASSNVNVGSLLDAMKKFHEKELPLLVEKSQKTLKETQKYITTLINNINTGKTSSDEAAKQLQAVNKGLQEQIDKLMIEKKELLDKINKATTDSADTKTKLSEKEKDINTLNEAIKKQNERIESILMTSEELRQKTTASTLKQSEELNKYNEDLTKNRDLLDKEIKVKQELQKKLEQQTNVISNMKSQLDDVREIKTYFEGIYNQTKALSNNNEGIKKFIDDIVEKEKQGSSGGYQYKSKNKSRSRRRYKGNRFGLLKSKSKTKKGKKKLKKKNKNIKGGMKTRTKSKRKSKNGKKTRKGKKKNNKRK